MVQNQLTSISGATTPAYDNNGNTTTDEKSNTYTYDAWNRLVKAVAGSNSVAYTIDGLGRRITSATNGGTATDLYYSRAWQVLEEEVSGAMTAQYVWSPVYVDALVERDTGSQRLYVQQDANWNVTALVSNTGTVQERYVYDPYGNPSFYTASWGTRTGSNYSWIYLHQGGRYDTNTTLYNFRNRDQSPTLGRWLKQDPIGYRGRDSNLYRYVSNSPLNRADPSGLLSINSPAGAILLLELEGGIAVTTPTALTATSYTLSAVTVVGGTVVIANKAVQDSSTCCHYSCPWGDVFGTNSSGTPCDDPLPILGPDGTQIGGCPLLQEYPGPCNSQE
jgi:RHS repeat-associated protein